MSESLLPIFAVGIIGGVSLMFSGIIMRSLISGCSQSYSKDFSAAMEMLSSFGIILAMIYHHIKGNGIIYKITSVVVPLATIALPFPAIFGGVMVKRTHYYCLEPGLLLGCSVLIVKLSSM